MILNLFIFYFKIIIYNFYLQEAFEEIYKSNVLNDECAICSHYLLYPTEQI